MKIYHIGLAGLLSATACGSAEPAAQAPIVFDSDSLLRHRIAGEQSVTVSATPEAGMIGVPIEVTISPEGAVIDARVDAAENYAGADPAPGVAAARAWRFRPFTYRGRPVVARGTIQFDYRGPELWRDAQVELPPIDYATLRIELVRSACYGSCPDYSVTIDGAGTVAFATLERSLEGAAQAHREFSLSSGVLIPGRHRSRIERPALDALIERFRQAHFFGLRREYRYGVTDNPTYRLTFTSGGRSWSVTDYVGEHVGMPHAVTALEDAVDAAAGSARWVRGTEATVAALREEGFDFRSRRAAQLAAGAMAGRPDEGASERFILDLIEAGLPLDQPFAAEVTVPLGEHLLLSAARSRRPAVFAALAGRGWLGRISRQRLSQVFAQSGGGCDPATARALVSAGADPAARTARTSAPGEGTAGGATALISALDPHGVCYRAARGPVIAALLALGVDPNAVDEEGKNALFGVEDPEVQEQLLAAGVRADVRDREGNSPAFSSWNDRIVLGLLDAGADPHGHYFDGKGLRAQAIERAMPSVIAWLDAHGIE
jgi:hypothetical protein